MGALDYAGGLVVEIVSGASGSGIGTGPRPADGFQGRVDASAQPAVRPCSASACSGSVGSDSTPGSALAADGMASQIFLNTLVAGCTGLLGWLFVEQNRDGHPTTFGAASGVVAGLVAITPSCGTVNMFGALVIGLIAGIVCSVRRGMEAQARLRRLPRTSSACTSSVESSARC